MSDFPLLCFSYELSGKFFTFSHWLFVSGECSILCKDWSRRSASGRGERLSVEERRAERWIWRYHSLDNPTTDRRTPESCL